MIAVENPEEREAATVMATDPGSELIIAGRLSLTRLGDAPVAGRCDGGCGGPWKGGLGLLD